MNATLEKLAQSYPQSHWRLRSAGSGGQLLCGSRSAGSQRSRFIEPASRPSRAIAESAACHWKVAWSTYLRDPAQAEGMLREHLSRYAASDQTSPALYYLGRIAESKSDWPNARAYYDAVSNAYPNYYYAILARERLETPSLLAASAAPATAQFLERDSNRKSSRSGKFRSHAAHQAANCARAFARHGGPRRSVGIRACVLARRWTDSRR